MSEAGAAAELARTQGPQPGRRLHMPTQQQQQQQPRSGAASYAALPHGVNRQAQAENELSSTTTLCAAPQPGGGAAAVAASSSAQLTLSQVGETAPLVAPAGARLVPADAASLGCDDPLTKLDICRTVAFGMKIFDIAEIDGLKQSFRCKYAANFRWIGRPEVFRPRVKLLNSIDHTFWKLDDLLPADADNASAEPMWDLTDHRVDTLNCSLDYRWFPFDTQQLRFHVRAILSGYQSDDQKGSYPLKPSRFLFGVQPHKLSEWQLSCGYITYKETSAKSNKYWADLVFTLYARRHYSSHTVNTIGFPFFLTLCVFAVSAISLEDSADRLSFILTLLLTLTAFRLMASDTIPKVPYLTAADIYILTNFLFVVLVMGESWMLAVAFPDEDRQAEVDGIALQALFALYVAWNLSFVCAVWHHLRRSRCVGYGIAETSDAQVHIGEIPNYSTTSSERASQNLTRWSLHTK